MIKLLDQFDTDSQMLEKREPQQTVEHFVSGTHTGLWVVGKDVRQGKGVWKADDKDSDI